MQMSAEQNPHAGVSGIPARLVYPVPEIAVLLGGVTERYVWHLIASGELKSFTLGRRRVVYRDDIDAFLRRLAEQAQVARAAAEAGGTNTGGGAGTGSGGGSGSGSGTGNSGGGAGTGPHRSAA